jgi:prepilin-type N-terminal cleavage/methylation domain-containing protein
MLSNHAVEQFKQLDAQAIEGIRDEQLREKARKLKAKQGGFTLLELLVVVAVLAIVAGTILGGITGVEDRSASSSAANSIAAVESLVKAYRGQGTVINDLDSLQSADCSACVANTTPAASATATTLPSTVLGAKLIGTTPNDGKITSLLVPAAGVDALRNAGIRNLRYLDSNSINESAGGTAACGISPESGVAFPCNTNFTAIDIPGRMYDPAASATGNRGRGFSASLTAATAINLPVWKRGGVASNFPDNRKVGASNDVLVALGFGNNVIIGSSNLRPQVNSAPAYGNLATSYAYNRYLTLWSVGTTPLNSTATGVTNYPDTATLNTATGTAPQNGFAPPASGVASFVAVVDTRGDFLDEEFAEGSGQKIIQ